MEYKTLILKYTDQRELLLDGRPITFVSKQIKFNRWQLALILDGKEPCTPTVANKIITRLKPGAKIEDYFEEYEG